MRSVAQYPDDIDVQLARVPGIDNGLQVGAGARYQHGSSQSRGTGHTGLTLCSFTVCSFTGCSFTVDLNLSAARYDLADDARALATGPQACKRLVD